MESKQSKEVTCNESNHHDIPTKIRKLDNEKSDSNQGSGSDNGIARNFDNVGKLAEAEEINPSASQTLEESVFSIDHILELIFLDLDQDQETLLSCRLVSRRWAYFASKELQKIVMITFTLKDEHDRRNGPPGFCKCDRYGLATNRNYPIENLTALLNSSTEFPCTSFSFKRPNLIYSLALPFFNHPMCRVKKLWLGDFHRPHFSIYFEDLKWLCLSQAQNLANLSLESDIVLGKSPSQIELLSHQKEKFVDGEEWKNVKTNLKVLKIKKGIPEDLLAELLESSPKLTKVQLEKKDYLPLLLKPRNRLHLLSKLKIRVGPVETDRLKVIANDSNWALQKLAIDSEEVALSSALKFEPQSFPGITNVLNKILRANTASLKKLVWGQMECLEKLVIPRMPGVTEIQFSIRFNTEYDYDIDEDEDYGQDITHRGKLFPVGVNIQATFPNLKEIEFCSELHTRVSVASLFHKLKPIPSVKSCYFRGGFRPDFGTFRKLMPNSTYN